MHQTDHEANLKAFAKKHLSGDSVHDYHIRLKLDHSMRVYDNARAIIDGEDITGPLAHQASLAALFHDIGRFPQYTRYGTFKDADSTNHGRLGVLTLREAGLPKGVSRADLRQIRAAVGLHNVKELNPKTPHELATVTKIVRDADKIDIFSVVLDHLEPKTESKPVVIHGLIEDPTKYSDTTYNTSLAGEVCDYGTLKYGNDFILLLIGWLFAMEFPTSISLLAKSGSLNRAFAILPNDEKIQALREKANTFMHYKIGRTP